MPTKRITILTSIMLIFQGVGLSGVLLGYEEKILPLTPLNFSISLLVLVLAHPSPKEWLLFACVIFLGWFVEVIGVNTGVPFGSYTYGTTLGVQVFSTPLIIGINWLVLLYAFHGIITSLKLRSLYKAGIVASLMVMIDILIEPVAVHLGFWEWQQTTPPLSNYLGWWIVSFAFSMIWSAFEPASNSVISYAYLMAQVVFFGLIFISI